MKKRFAASIFATLIASLGGFSSGQVTPPGPSTQPKPATQRATPPAVKTTIPPKGKPLADADKAAIEKGIADLGAAIAELKTSLRDRPELLHYLPDIQIYHNALRYPLEYDEPIDIKQAAKAIVDGMERANELKAGKHAWTAVSGPRGYLSKIDGSVQPYILSIPTNYKPGQVDPLPLALSCHGRSEALMELVFISTKVGEGNAGNSTVGDTKNKFIVYLYGRYCCANKLAGEIDLFEAWKRVAEQYPIDTARVAVTGFSMGGGASWHFAAHYGSDWVCATPGAGFSESERFLHLAENHEVPPWYESALYHLYNATDQASNCANYPVIAYAGEKDGQKQAGDVMEEAMKARGLTLERFTGPNTQHAYERETKKKLDARVEQLVQQGKNFVPQHVQFETYSLRYDNMLWVTVAALEKHWEKASVDAKIDGAASLKIMTTNVDAMYIKFPLKQSPFARDAVVTVEIDGQKIKFTADDSLVGMFTFFKADGKWSKDRAAVTGLTKHHELQGPIDDAFMDSFVIVEPTADGMNSATAGWAAGECKHAVDHWRKQFRGEARVKTAATVSDDDIAQSNLVLFGDPQSNPLIAKVLPKLPIEWTKTKLVVNGQTFDAARYVPVMIFPNPLNPKKYVVLNSGFTFRENDYTNNARQTPKLPDYAVIDTQSPPNEKGWGQLPKAGFFGERWEWQKDDGKIQPQ